MLRDILAFLSPTLLVLAGFSYYRATQAIKRQADVEKNVREGVASLAIDIANLQAMNTQLSHRIDQVASSFVDGRECPMCGVTRPAKEFGENDYVCAPCRDETLTELIQELEP